MRSRVTPFESWMVRVNLAMHKRAGYTSEANLSYDYYSSYQAGMTADETAREAIELKGAHPPCAS